MQKAIRATAIILAVGLLIALLIYNSMNPAKPEAQIWSQAMTLGDIETAEHKFYDYTDIMCPYCDKFALAMDAHLDDFKKEYVEEKKVYYELRLTNLLASFHPEEDGLVANSTNSALAGYCAADQNKFWEWYGWILNRLNDDYFSKGIGDSSTAKQRVPKLEASYFSSVGDAIEGLDESGLAECMTKTETKETLNKWTKKAAAKIKGGLPYYVFNSYISPGFDGNWETEHDWKNAKTLFEAGIASKK